MTAVKVNLTKTYIEGLLPSADADRLVYRDTKVDGLELRVTASGHKSFSVYRWIPAIGRPGRVNVGKFPDMSVEQARKAAQQILADIAAGKNPIADKAQAKAEVTFAKFFELYIKDHSKPHKRTWEEDVEKYERYLSSNKFGVDLSQLKLSAITRADVAKLHAKIGQRSKVVANRVLALVSSIYGKADDWGSFKGPNPAKGIKRFKEVARTRKMSATEAKSFFDAISNEKSRLFADFFVVCLLTGARRGNVQSMRWQDIDLGAGIWTVPAGDSKNGEPMQLALVPAVGEILKRREQEANGPFVFEGEGKSGHLVEPKMAWQRLKDEVEFDQLRALLTKKDISVPYAASETAAVRVARARAMADGAGINRGGVGLPGLRIHDLRRTMGSWMVNTGASLPMVGKGLGHLSSASTKVYAVLDHDPVASAMSKAADALLKAGKQESQ